MLILVIECNVQDIENFQHFIPDKPSWQLWPYPLDHLSTTQHNFQQILLSAPKLADSKKMQMIVFSKNAHEAVLGHLDKFNVKSKK